ADPVAWLKGLHSVRPLSYVARISPRPLFIVHGTGDELIPYQHALKLFEQAGEPKKLLIIPGAAHQLRKNREAVSECLEWFKNISAGKL
ncbi:MAG: prolyl oligopeptidase family serine peptidase, partial [Bacillota bacterium]|nr:prolyl oligopeptidase family serine peptidase [Bacillota bacterium]